MKKLKALFIGGTGTISTDITKLISASPQWELTLLNRGQRNSRLPADANIRHWALDINDENAVKNQLEGETFDVVANFINFSVESVERDIRLFSGKTKQYTFISSASAYQKPLSHYVITESTPLSNPYWGYSQAKIACEERLMAEYRANGFPVTIVRPSHTYDMYSVPISIHGKHGSWQTLKRMQQGKPVLVPGDGTSLWTLTHSTDFARAFVGLMGNIHATGEAIHITSDESLTWNQVYQAIGNALGVVPKLYHVSTDFLVACNPSQLGPLIGDKSNTVVFDNSKIKRLVPGFAATTRFDEGICTSVEYFVGNPHVQVEDPDFDKFTEAVISAQEKAKVEVAGVIGG